MTNNIANINRAFYQEGSSIAYRNFMHSLRSQKTRSEYVRSLHYYMAWLKMDVLRDDDNYDKLLRKDPKLITSDIIGFILYLKDNKKRAYIAALRQFYNMNDMEDLKWKKINSFKGEYYNVTEDRPYSREEIKILVDRTDLRNKAIILLMSSSGLRIGAIPDSKVGDLAPIDKYNLYQKLYVKLCYIIYKHNNLLIIIECVYVCTICRRRRERYIYHYII